MNHNFYCFNCGCKFNLTVETLIKFTNKYGKWNGTPCIKCKEGNAKIIGSKSTESVMSEDFRINSLAQDDNGNEVALNKHGKPVDNYYKKDPRGWKHAGKRNIASKTSHGKDTGY